MDHLRNLQEHLANITASPLHHQEPMLNLLPHLSESTPPEYRSLSTSQVTRSLTSLVRYSIVPNLGQPSNLVTTVQNPGSSSGSLIPSSIGRKTPTQVASMVSGVMSSTRKTPVIG